MPIEKGTDRKTIQENIKRLVKEGYKQDKAIAIAMEEARKSKSKR